PTCPNAVHDTLLEQPLHHVARFAELGGGQEQAHELPVKRLRDVHFPTFDGMPRDVIRRPELFTPKQFFDEPREFNVKDWRCSLCIAGTPSNAHSSELCSWDMGRSKSGWTVSDRVAKRLW
ncbi:hypothetical protein ACS229_27060, partial [Klebsiella pneumoniae]|uniref:hypothetical protein n=1 Tax=Klebsiella pneumoniae TaxID=573 RepID=UPI003F28621F